MNHRRNTRIFGMALAASALILIGGAATARAASPAAPVTAQPPQVALQAETPAPRKAVRVIGIHGHENCAHVEIRREANGSSGEARCIRRF
jgi:hypothetical protein